MSSPLVNRLLLSLNNAKHRLAILAVVCRDYEKPSIDYGDDRDEFERLYGPHSSDIEELEESIERVSLLIENLQHEQESSENGEAFPVYPLCTNGWTLKEIEQLDEEQEDLSLEILDQLSLQILAEHQNQLDQQLQSTTGTTTNDDNLICTLPTSDSAIQSLLDLPPELLLHICSFLSPYDRVINLAHTCRYLANLILTRVQSHLDLTKVVSVFEVTRLLPYVPYLRSITFTEWDDEVSILTWAIWCDRIARTAPKLHTLRFRSTAICPILICLIVEYFPHCLQTIKFDPQRTKNYEKFDLVLSLLADNRMQLRRVVASYQLGITNFGVLQLVNHLNMIVELQLMYIDVIDDETMKALCDKHQAHLEILQINATQLTDRSLEYLDQCRKLKSITIEFCTNLTGSNFHIFQNFPDLQELCLSKLTEVPLESFQLLFNGEHIFAHLTLLKLDECHFIDDTCVQAIIAMCPRLIDFTCSWAYNLTDESFNEIVMRCQHLRRLSLLGCHQIYGHMLQDVPEKYLPNIEYLCFQQCNQIKDELLLDLCKRKRSVSILDYYGSTVVDDSE